MFIWWGSTSLGDSVWTLVDTSFILLGFIGAGAIDMAILGVAVGNQFDLRAGKMAG